MANENITADVVEIQEFQDLAHRYEVFSVPKTVINDAGDVIGALPESVFLGKVMESYSKG